MTTSKRRVTIYLSNPQPLDLLFDELRRLAPLEARGAISRSTCIEAAIGLALADVQARGRESDLYRRLVTSPRCTLCGNDAAMVKHPGGDIWYCQTCGTSDYISEAQS